MDTLLLFLRTAFRSFRKSGRQEERQIKEYVTPVSESTSRVDRRVILSWGDYCLWKERRHVDLVLNPHDGFATYRTGLSHLGKVDDWPSRLISLTVQCYGENRMGRAASTLHIYWNLISLHYCTQLRRLCPIFCNCFVLGFHLFDCFSHDNSKTFRNCRPLLYRKK